MSAEHTFLMGSETEYLTVLEGSADLGMLGVALQEFVRELRELAPSLPGPAGIFSGYGRTYVDAGMHLEFASCECDSPFLLALVIERQQELLRQAAGRLALRGKRIVLANTNHDGILSRGVDTWGAHESYLVRQHPAEFGPRILPFLATRLFAGSGARRRDGAYVHCVRTEFMEFATGGGTTDRRALHSTAREEHLAGPRPEVFRYHLISGDSHRSQYNLALQFGATALAIVAALEDSTLERELRDLPRPLFRSWVRTAKVFNVLARGAEDPRIDPRALRIQRLYLEAAKRYAAHHAAPTWAASVLDAWEDTLDAYGRMDLDWLAARLDAFTKYRLHEAHLADSGRDAQAFAGNVEFLAELALLDHDYHDLLRDDSPFRALEQAGVLQHRVGAYVGPGEEAEPFVPATQTRARPRARFIAAYGNEGAYTVDWAWIHDPATRRFLELFDPFAAELSENWREGNQLTNAMTLARRTERARLAQLEARRSGHQGTSQAPPPTTARGEEPEVPF